MKRIIICVLVAVMLCTACVEDEALTLRSSEQLEVTPIRNVTGMEIKMNEDQKAALNGFAANLFQKCFDGERNTLISPVSVLYALSMTEGGAKGETLAQMEALFGLSMEELRDCLHLYQMELNENESNTLYLANSIWFKDDEKLTVEENFLNEHAGYYDAELYKAAFDEETARDINAWVEEKTDGQIKDILNGIPDEAIMYLINALSFDAEWESIYNDGQVWEDTFHAENGEEQTVDFMHSEEDIYLEDSLAAGFMKYYADREYALVAMLPGEGVSVQDYIAFLSEQGLETLWDNLQVAVEVHTAIPKFNCKFDIEMSDVLKELGITNAFDEDLADFSGIGHHEDGNLYINRVLHKTSIEVDEKGTKAGAATVVEMATETALQEENEPKFVYLDRPFVYFIIDCETNLPLFMGTMLSVK